MAPNESVVKEYSDSDGSSLSDSGYDNSYGGHFDEGVVGEKGHDSSLKDNVSKGHSNEVSTIFS